VAVREYLDLLIIHKQFTKTVVTATVQQQCYLQLSTHLCAPSLRPETHLSAPHHPEQARRSTEHSHCSSNTRQIKHKRLSNQTRITQTWASTLAQAIRAARYLCPSSDRPEWAHPRIAL